MAVLEGKLPSHALTVKALRVPLALASGVQTRLWPEDRTVRPAVTGTPSLVRVPVETEAMRNETVSPLSASASSAAAARAA